MKTLVIKILIIGMMTLAFTSCKKYPDGPTLSWTSAVERVSNSWKIAKAMNGGEDVTNDFEQYDITFTKSYSATLHAKYKAFGGSYDYYTEGTWSFSDDEKKLNVNYNDDDADKTYIILRLTEDEMWLKEDGTELELYLAPR